MYQLPPLPYAPDALQPCISKETVDYHYGKHHRAYVDKLNELVGESDFKGSSLEDIIKNSTGPIFNNAAQVWNHNFYWSCLRRPTTSAPQGELIRAIEQTFGSLDEFKRKFSECAVANFGSGWTWLVVNNDGDLAIQNTDDADDPLVLGQAALLTCDVWEHAYYIDYRHQRAEYLKQFWQIVNWEFAAENFNQAEALMTPAQAANRAAG